MDNIIIIVGMILIFMLTSYAIKKFVELQISKIREKMRTQTAWGILNLQVRYCVCILVNNTYTKVMNSDHESYDKAEQQLLVLAGSEENQNIEFAILPIYKAKDIKKSWEQNLN